MKRMKTMRSFGRFRIFLATGFFFAIFGVIIGRAFQLQVLQGPELKKRAEDQHTRTLTIQSRRGDIYDRNHKELAVSIEVDSIYAQTEKMASLRETARKLAPVLSMKVRDVEKRLASRRGFVWIRRQVDLKDKDRELISSIDGVGIIKESRRYYPNGPLAGSLIGFTGVDSKGLEGLELYYDNVLKGATLKVTGERDARGRTLLFEDVDKKVPLEGMMVELTIDKTIQYIAEKELGKAVEGSNARGGMAVVMEPFTGEILAMAVQPTFNPNNYSRYTPAEWRNRAVTDNFEPGSIFKLFLLSTALEENLVKPGEIIWCENGRYRVAGRTFHDTKKHGWLSVPQILKYSSNIGSAKIGERIGKERLFRYLTSFGFGEKAGIDLPGEGTGKLRHYGEWSAVTVDTVSFGQGVSATGVQLVSALSAIANGGFLMKPYVVKSVKDPNGKVISESHPMVVRRVISEATARRMTEMLMGVVRKGGTGEKAALEDFDVAGKTATAQKPDLDDGGYMKEAYVSSFFGYVPAREPELAILVTVDEPEGDYHGGDVAAPVFREIASQSLAYMGLQPARIKSEPIRGGDGGGFRLVRASASKRPILKEVTSGDLSSPPRVTPDFKGLSMRMVVRLARNLSVDVDLVGSGVAISQKPAPGKRLSPGGHVTVYFE